MTSQYLTYEVYVTCSTSEGFGLSILEALDSGLSIIGLDVRYWNQTFVRDGENGYLVDYLAIEKRIISFQNLRKK